MNDPTTEFVAALDTAARSLLEKAGISAKVTDGKSSAVVTVAEQVKAFEAVVDWAKTRRELVPKPKEKSAFDDIKSRFNGEAPQRRGNAHPGKASKSRSAAGSGSGDASGADPDGSEQP